MSQNMNMVSTFSTFQYAVSVYSVVALMRHLLMKAFLTLLFSTLCPSIQCTTAHDVSCKKKRKKKESTNYKLHNVTAVTTTVLRTFFYPDITKFTLKYLYGSHMRKFRIQDTETMTTLNVAMWYMGFQHVRNYAKFSQIWRWMWEGAEERGKNKLEIKTRIRTSSFLKIICASLCWESWWIHVKQYLSNMKHCWKTKTCWC